MVTNGIVLPGYVNRYQKYEVYQPITQTPTTEAFYPEIALCLSGRKYALKYLIEKGLSKIDKINSPYYWSNKVFFLSQYSPPKKYLFNSEFEKTKYMISHEETNCASVTWHSQKKLYQNLFRSQDSFVLLDLIVPKLRDDLEILLLTINEQNVSGIYQNPSLFAFANLIHQLTFSKTMIIRKPYPFHHGAHLKQNNISFLDYTTSKFVNL